MIKLTKRLNGWWLVPLLVGLGAALAAWQQSRVPKRRDWQQAIEIIRSRIDPGDGVAWVPYWAGEGRVFLEGLPAFHLVTSASADDATDAASGDLSRYDRVWLLGAFGRDAGSLQLDRVDRGHRVTSRERVGALTLERIAVGGERVVGDLYATLDKVEYRRRDEQNRAQICDFWDGRGWHCNLKRSPEATRRCLEQPVSARYRKRQRGAQCHLVDCSLRDCGLDPWLHVSRDVHVIGDAPRRCVWFHPIAKQTVVIDWADAPAGDSLVVDYGFVDKIVSDNQKRHLRVRPAKLRVQRTGETLAEIDVAAEKGWRRLRTPLDGTAQGIRFELETRSQVDAYFCFDPTIRRAR